MSPERTILIPSPSPLLPTLLRTLLPTSTIHLLHPAGTPPPHPPHPNLHLHTTQLPTTPAARLTLLLLPPAAPTPLATVLHTAPTALAAQLESSFHRPWAAVQAVLPAMRSARYGHVVAVCGVTAEMGFPGLGARCAGDGMLAGVLEGLAYEVAPFGVRVTTVVCGLGVVRVAGEEGEAEAVERVRRLCGAGEEETVAEVAEVVRRIAGERDPPVRVWVGEEVREGVRERLRVLSEEMEGVLGGVAGDT